MGLRNDCIFTEKLILEGVKSMNDLLIKAKKKRVPLKDLGGDMTHHERINLSIERWHPQIRKARSSQRPEGDG